MDISGRDKNSILEKIVGGTENPRVWEEDTGTGGSYPNSVDRIIMEIAGFELYKTTGDKEFLEKIYEISKNTLEQDYHVAYDEQSGLFKGRNRRTGSPLKDLSGLDG